MGDYDFVKVVLERLAAERAASAFSWMQVAIKPAKPLAFGIVDSAHGVPVFGLPGNPVSSRVSFELFARPALRRMAGPDRAARPDRARPTARTAFGADGGRASCTSTGCRSRSRTVATCASGPGSRRATCSRAWPRADGLARIPDGKGVAAGDEVEVLLLGP